MQPPINPTRRCGLSHSRLAWPEEPWTCPFVGIQVAKHDATLVQWDKYPASGKKRHISRAVLNGDRAPCPGLQRSMEVSLGRLSVGGASSDQPLSHATEEFVLVLKGCMDVEVAHSLYRLETGDSICHHRIVPHRNTAAGDKEVVFQSAVSPPIEVVMSPTGGIVDVE